VRGATAHLLKVQSNEKEDYNPSYQWTPLTYSNVHRDVNHTTYYTSSRARLPPSELTYESYLQPLVSVDSPLQQPEFQADKRGLFIFYMKPSDPYVLDEGKSLIRVETLREGTGICEIWFHVEDVL